MEVPARQRQEAANNRRRWRWASLFAVIGAVVLGATLGSGGRSYWFDLNLIVGAVVVGVLGLMIAVMTEPSA